MLIDIYYIFYMENGAGMWKKKFQEKSENIQKSNDLAGHLEGPRKFQEGAVPLWPPLLLCQCFALFHNNTD